MTPTDETPSWPELTLPDAEAELLKSHYDAARVVLEYGSGGSTVYAAHRPNTLCISVESDPGWALDLQIKLDQALPGHQAIVYHADIGPVGAWGRPLDDTYWQSFFRYPLQVWSEPFFRHPDVVLVDGRFRPACVLATALMIKRAIPVLMDDYIDRPFYAQIEQILQPKQQVGRMAEFWVEPLAVTPERLMLLADLMTQATFPVPGKDHVNYAAGPSGRPQFFAGNPHITARVP